MEAGQKQRGIPEATVITASTTDAAMAPGLPRSLAHSPLSCSVAATADRARTSRAAASVTSSVSSTS